MFLVKIIIFTQYCDKLPFFIKLQFNCLVSKSVKMSPIFIVNVDWYVKIILDGEQVNYLA